MSVLTEIQRELKAPKNQYNSFGKYAYRSTEDILEAIKPIMHSKGATLTISDDIVEIGGRVYVKATVSFKCGQEVETVTSFARESLDKKGMDSAQITGAASSYARKYALSGMFLIDDNKDLDTMDNKEPSRNNEEDLIKAEEYKLAMDAAKTAEDLKSIFAEAFKSIKTVEGKKIVSDAKDKAKKRLGL